MEFTISSLFFLYGLIFGSFFNVVGLRVPNKTLLNQKRSCCDTCNRKLTWKELIPIFSYVKQNGNCLKCHQPISKLYPILELLTGILFSLTYIIYGINSHTLLGLLLISLIIPVTVSDVVYKQIPNRLLLFFGPLFLIYRLFFPLDPFWVSLLGTVFAFVLIFIVIYLSKGGMGGGDLKYFTLFGFVFGFYSFLLLFFLSTLYGTLYSLIMIKKGRLSRKSRMAFGPFIGAAALTVYFIGDVMMTWYWNLFL